MKNDLHCDQVVTVQAPVSELVDEAASKAAIREGVEVQILPGAFMERVQKTETCWLWLGHKDRNGYGKLKFEGLHWRAHRFAYSFVEPLLDGEVVAHHCDTPACVRPDHLFVATQAGNMADRDRKGRTQRGATHYAAKLDEAAVLRIRSSPERSAFLAGFYGVSQRTIRKIRCRTIWKHVR